MKSSELQRPVPILARRLSKAQIQSASPEDQALFLTIAHVANEMNALLRATVWSSDFNSAVRAEVDGQRTLTLMFLELLAGKLNEAHNVIEGAYFGSVLAKTYAARIKPCGHRALEQIRRYFSHDNIVDRIRNNFAFHYSRDMRRMLTEAVPSVGDDLVCYMQRHNVANNLFYFAEVITAEALFQAIGMTNNQEALEELSSDLFDVAKNFSVLFDELMGAFLDVVGQEAWQAPAEPVVFDRLPVFSEVRIPWFTTGSVPTQ